MNTITEYRTGDTVRVGVACGVYATGEIRHVEHIRVGGHGGTFYFIMLFSNISGQRNRVVSLDWYILHNGRFIQADKPEEVRQ